MTLRLLPLASWIRRAGDSGHLTLAVAIITAGMLMLVEVIDFGALKLRAGRDALSIAQEAARAGADALDRPRTYTSGLAVINPQAALTAASTYLHTSVQPGEIVTGQATLLGTTQIKVTVTITRHAPLLSLIGTSSIRVTRSATAELVSGVRPPAT
jgi:hypothetical protein